MKRILYILCLLLTLNLFISCNKKSDNSSINDNIIVTIVYGEGFDNEVYTLKKGEKLTEPKKKEVEHKELIGYTYENGNTFSFDTPLNNDLTIYALWQTEQVTATFFGFDRKTIIEEVTIDYGSTLIYPAEPSIEQCVGYVKVFDSWSKKVDKLTSNIAIYAKYKEVYEQINITIKNIDLEIVDTKQIDYGDSIYELEEPNINKKEGYYYKFLGWYNELTDELFDFDQEITKNTTIYPKYKVGKIKKLLLEESTISFLGDSISTFYSPNSDVNSFYGGENEFYYPTYSQTVKDVTKTWWYQTYTQLGSKLGINNSLSGSAAYGSSNEAGMSSTRINTLDNNGTPNIVIIFLGTNDNVNGHTKENIETAYKSMIEQITTNYVIEDGDEFIVPDIYIINNGYTAYNGYYYTETKRLEYNEVFKKLADAYNNVKLFDLASLITKDNYAQYLGDNLHYNSDGMTLIALNLTKQIKKDYE